MFQIILGRNSKIEELSHSRLDETYLLRGQTSKTAQPSSQSISVTLRGLNYIPNQDPTVLPHGGIYHFALPIVATLFLTFPNLYIMVRYESSSFDIAFSP